MGINHSGSEPRQERRVSSPPPKKTAHVQVPVAIIGMACRLPGESDSPHKLWDLLERGGIARNEAPESRFNLRTHHDGSKKPKTMRSPGGMFLENVDPRNFDAQFFGISRTDAIAMDPQQRQLLEVVYECLENAGVSIEMLDGADVACFVGSYAVDYADMQARDPDDRAPSITVGVGRAILSNRISHFLNIKGPSMTIDTACSGSLVGVDVACRYLHTGEADGAIVAGSNLYLSPEHNMDGGAMKGASSLSGKCHTFDIKADGYIKAEGVNAVLLKRLDDAIRDGDPIRAVIRGTATNSDGRTPGIASPSSEAQATAIRAAYANAGITNLRDTTYLECHGTGTQAGDPTEVAGVASVFSSSRTSDNPLIIGSIKGNIGHSEPAAGLSGLIKAILTLENGVIPGNPTFVTPNPKIDFQALNVRASRTSITWPQGAIKRASVNSFGYGGSNAHVVLESVKGIRPDAPIKHISSYIKGSDDFFADDELPGASRPSVLVFSANSEKSLQTYFKKISQHLLNPNVKVSLTDLAYTLSERRTRHFHRGYIVAKSSRLDETAFITGKKATEAPRVGFVFTGQGAQWSQMGKALVDTFASAKLLLQSLDKILQSCAAPPPWSLLKEVTEARNPELLRQPEFSQPLVTAIQLVIVKILADWGVNAQFVVGHSSGEIAAACAAGYLSPEDAIKAAFYRGQAAKNCNSVDAPAVGMMAVGLGPEKVSEYITSEDVQIACFNSPNSVTLSGTLMALEELRSRLLKDQHFARLLQVNLAYHSKFMKEIGESYEKLLDRDFQSSPFKITDVTMFSSVYGRQMEGLADTAYWKSNMVSPVLFDQALKQMLSGKNGANFLIEIGPSGALAGPVKQVKNSLGAQGMNVSYCAALTRGQDAIQATFSVAGQIFVAGGSVDLARVNQGESKALPASPSIIVDLPNYHWNYATKYWYESEASKDWRNRLFPHHDLIGSKVLGTSWHSPSWKKTLRIEDLPWLRDHRMGTEIVFPAAGFMAMAVEAITQCNEALAITESKARLIKPSYRLRNITFPKALVLEETREDHRVMTTLVPFAGRKDSWYEFKILSLTDDVWSEHCRGLVRSEEAASDAQQVPKPLSHTVSGQLWYKAMHDAGYNFGPLFQKQLKVESLIGERHSRSLVDLTDPPSEYPQSVYALHPAALDGCLQTCAPSLWNGDRAGVSAVLIPAIIDDLEIRPQQARPKHGVSATISKYVGLGRREETKNYMSNASVYDPDNGATILKLTGLRYHTLDTREDVYASHRYSGVVWKPDIDHLEQVQIPSLLPQNRSGPSATSYDEATATVHALIDLVAHKKPNLTVMEINMVQGNTESAWLGDQKHEQSIRAACSKYEFTSVDAAALLEAQEQYSKYAGTVYNMLDISRPGLEVRNHDDRFDLVILQMQPPSRECTRTVISNVQGLLSENGHFLFLTPALGSSSSSSEDLVLVKSETEACANFTAFSSTLQSERFIRLRDIPCGFSETYQSAQLSVLAAEETEQLERHLDVVRFTRPTEVSTCIQASLRKKGWKLSEHKMSFQGLKPKSIVLVLDELSAPILSKIDEDQWKALQMLANSGSKILWLSKRSQLTVPRPENAMIHGLARTIRAEDPSVSFTTLDVESAGSVEATEAILKILESLLRPAPRRHLESEFVERAGIIYVSRIRPDHLINNAEQDDSQGGVPDIRSLHDSPVTVRLRCERLGTIDSLCYAEVDSKELHLPDGCVEVELASAGLNFKDIAVTMGIVPENQYLLGLEGAGVVRRVGKVAASQYHIGQRVLVFEKGTFGNRIIATTERTHAIPDSMSFEEAATLPSVYLTAIYSIFDLANTRKGYRVLIHSASGGLGIASIQLCHYLGAEVFATVGTQEKRNFLTETFGIPADHIFSSRSTAFAPELIRLTQGKGVDVILNSLTGDILDESWRCIAEGGTMVELGKKDMLDRNTLSMEPFGRNASYRCFDMSHKHVSDSVIAQLLTKLMELIKHGHVKPISPIKTFGFDDIPSAFRYMRSANHIGKIVISNMGKKDFAVPIRPAPRQLTLRDDKSILIVGGLKGLCGSLAIYLAGLGARCLTIMARSGYDDDRSQGVLRNIYAKGCKVSLITGDVANLADVRRAFDESSMPIGGVIQGAMVLRDKIFTSMTIKDYRDAVTCKVPGTWNLHNVALERSLPLDFFTMLSSVSGVVGQKGQANYAAANVFLDAFATYRRSLGLAACSVDLGAIEDVGYMHEHEDLVVALDKAAWTPINEALFHRIVRTAILQQVAPVNPDSAQLITSVAVPQLPSSSLLVDARFSGLIAGGAAGATAADGKDGGAMKELQAFFLLLKSGADAALVLNACVEIVNKQFVTMLRLSEPMEPAKSLSSYGMDSLAAVEFRNWARMDLGADLTTLDVTNAASLIALCEKIVSKIPA